MRFLGLFERRRTRPSRRRSTSRNRLTASIFDGIAEGIVVTDPEGHVVCINRAFQQLTGLTEPELRGRGAVAFLSSVHEADFYRAIRDSLDTTGRWQGEIWLKHKDGTETLEWLSASVVRDRDGRVVRYVGVFSDFSAIGASEKAIEQMAHFDPLTGLPNRLLFEARLTHALERARAGEGRLALLTVDLDNFEAINASLGRSAGDRVLRQVAARFRRVISPENTVARRGGDEFAVLLEHIADPQDAALTAENLLRALEQPFPTDGQEVYCAGSIGIALFPDDAREATELTRHAEVAMYRASEGDRNSFQFFTKELTSRAFERLLLEASLRHAVERGEFVLWYQPQVAIDSGAVVGCEALVRWHHPEMGLVAPTRFIPLAEERGIIVSIGRWVLEEACRQARAWADAGLPTRMAVNISGRQLNRPDLVDHVRGALEQSGLDPKWLELEVTESTMMTSAEAVIANLDAVRDLGVSIAIDDFGTGYSSMNYLKRFPVQRLKVDQSFVHDLPRDESDRAIATAIVALARSLHLSVIAEGVETRAQRDFLAAAGCDEIQGYLAGPPLTADAYWERVGKR